MAIYLSNDDVDRLLSLEDGLEVLEDLQRQQARGLVELIPRRRFSFPNGQSQLLMGGSVLGSNAYGIRNRNLSLLFDTETLEIQAAIQPSRVAEIRTGAMTALATRYMARQDASVAGVIGTGRQAANQLEAICLVRPIKHAKAYGRNESRRLEFARQMTERLGIEVVATSSAEECVRGAQVVVTATTSSEPVLLGAWLDSGTHICAIGANNWSRRELDEAAIERSDLVVVDSLEQAKAECGDLIWAAEPQPVPGKGYSVRMKPAVRWWDVVELHDVVSGRVAGRPSPDAVTLFEAQGVGTADVACYARAYRNARMQGVGVELPF